MTWATPLPVGLYFIGFIVSTQGTGGGKSSIFIEFSVGKRLISAQTKAY